VRLERYPEREVGVFSGLRQVLALAVWYVFYGRGHLFVLYFLVGPSAFASLGSKLRRGYTCANSGYALVPSVYVVVCCS
jgi:hypothetical protein